MSSTRMYSRKQRTLPVITTMDLWQLMKLVTCSYTDKKTHELPQKTIHHASKCTCCHRSIVVITGRAHCFQDYKYITHVLILRELNPKSSFVGIFLLLIASLLLLYPSLRRIRSIAVDWYCNC